MLAGHAASPTADNWEFSLRRLRRLALRDMPALRRRIAALTGFLAPARRQSLFVTRHALRHRKVETDAAMPISAKLKWQPPIEVIVRRNGTLSWRVT
jgi:hypothetical protein